MKAEKIVALRNALGWDIRRCAAYLGVDKATWRQWEAGMRAPSKGNAEALLALQRHIQTAHGRATLACWADDADRRRARRRQEKDGPMA